MNKTTSLIHQHLDLKAKMAPFAGWDMPLWYEGTLAEHHNVRHQCGLFDVSHMGQVFISGDDAPLFLEWLLPSPVATLQKRRSCYTALLNEDGGVVDDLMIYRLESTRYLLCINAANIEKDILWIEKQRDSFQHQSLSIENMSSQYSQLALQGPNSTEILKNLYKDASALAFGECVSINIETEEVLLARTGYTGEVGYEFYIPNSNTTLKLWSQLLALGAVPCGLAARDLLRTEACYPLYGNELNDAVPFTMSGLKWITNHKKQAFMGEKAFHGSGFPQKSHLRAFVLEEPGIPRAKMAVLNLNGDEVGAVTSGAKLPSLGQAGGMILFKEKPPKTGEKILIDVRGKRKLAKVCPKPLYSNRIY